MKRKERSLLIGIVVVGLIVVGAAFLFLNGIHYQPYSFVGESLTATTTASSSGLPSLSILAPANGVTLSTDYVTVTLQSSNFDTRTQGHYHVSIDGANDQTGQGTTFTFTNLSPGPHIIRASLENTDNSPLNPPVERTLSFTVSGNVSPQPSSSTTTTPSSPVKSFTIHAHTYAFDVTNIAVNKGDTVKITLISDDIGHDLCVDGYGCTQIVSGGQSSTLTFVANQTGNFAYYCNVDSHRESGMTGTMNVQ